MNPIKDILALRKLCLSDTNALIRSLGVYDEKNRYSFVDRGSNVLAIAHVDTVYDSGYDVRRDYPGFSVRPIYSRKKARKAGLSYSPSSFPATMITSGSLDDRLGIFILDVLLPRFGVLPDILYTQDEEIAASTARSFVAPRQYNWIFSFDRRGVNVVMYDYETPEHVERLSTYGYTVERGSYSDIRVLERLGVTGFNFGNGSDKEHSVKCHVALEVVYALVRRFVAFYRENAGIHYPHTPIERFESYGMRSTWSYGSEIENWSVTPRNTDPGGLTVDKCTVCGVWMAQEDLYPVEQCPPDERDSCPVMCYDCAWELGYDVDGMLGEDRWTW